MKRVVLMIIDGLRADMLSPEYTPHLASIAERSCVFTRQRSVFPSATRINSASIATGCFPCHHGLQGNAIALDEGNGLQAVSVGPAGFRERWRRATGRTLHRPTLAERLGGHGGALIYSNSSPGAAHMQDPDGHGWLYHRSGSFAPGFNPITDEQHLDVSYDAGGDRTTTERFCAALEQLPDQALTTLWICEPDHSQHALELGSPEHRAILAGVDSCALEVANTVQRLRGQGEDILFIIASDHGHETVSDIIPVTELLIDAGFKSGVDSSDVVLASSGMSALIYLSPEAITKREAIAAWLRRQAWTGQVFAAAELQQVNHRSDTALAIAFSMAKKDSANRFGIIGLGAVAADPFSPNDSIGLGQHGGLGPYECNPCLLISGGGFAPGKVSTPSSSVDIAPTILNFLNLPYAECDGVPLTLHRSSNGKRSSRI